LVKPFTSMMIIALPPLFAVFEATDQGGVCPHLALPQQ
jgi:hypothetical protein